LSIPLQLAVYGGLIPATVTALVFFLGSLATKRAAWTARAWTGLAIAAGFVVANLLLDDAATPWIPRSSRDWLPPLAMAGALAGVAAARFEQAWVGRLGCASLAAIAGWTLVPDYANIAPHLTGWRVGLGLTAFAVCLLCRRSAARGSLPLAMVLAVSFVVCALLIEHSGGLSRAQLAGAGCATTAAAAAGGWLLAGAALPAAAAPVSAILLVGLAAQGYFEGFGVSLASFALVAATPAVFAIFDLLDGRLTPRKLLVVRLVACAATLALAVALAFLR